VPRSIRLLFASLCFCLLSEGQSPDALRLEIESPPELAPFRARLAAWHKERVADILSLVGLPQPGAPIRIVLATEASEWARDVRPWVAGFAVESVGLIVLFPDRSPAYPDDNFDDVFRHELTHVLVWRAAGGEPVPRWFDEGLAMAAERDRRFKDQTELLYQLLTGSSTTLVQLNALFAGGRNEQIRAYAIAGAIVHDILQRHGRQAGSQILARVRTGASFDDACRAATGLTLESLEAAFWRRQRIWTMWLPIVGSSTTLWLGITFLALLAIYMRHRKNREIEKRWEEEDRNE